MTTAATIIKEALQDLGVLGVGKSPSSEDETDCLRKLNDILEVWSLSSLMVPFRTQVSHTLDGSESYTIGSGADINTTRPTFIDTAYVTFNGDDTPVTVIRDRGTYDRIYDKGIPGRPYCLYYEPSVPNGTIFVHYAGDSSYTLVMSTRGQLTSFPDTTTDVDLAPGYNSLIKSHLALRCASKYEVTPSDDVRIEARDAMIAIKRINRQSPVMTTDVPVYNQNRYNIEVE